MLKHFGNKRASNVCPNSLMRIMSPAYTKVRKGLLASCDRVVVVAAASNGITSKFFVHTLSHD